MIKQYDKVKLKDGYYAFIVEIFNDGEAYMADIDKEDGTHTEHVLPDDIAEVIKDDIE